METLIKTHKKHFAKFFHAEGQLHTEGLIKTVNRELNKIDLGLHPYTELTNTEKIFKNQVFTLYVI